jgi:hypothetical protein
LLAFSPTEKAQVRLEVWKALFGDVLPQPLELFATADPSPSAAPPPPFHDEPEKQLASLKAGALGGLPVDRQVFQSAKFATAKLLICYNRNLDGTK